MEITPNPAPGASTSTQVESDRDRLSDTFDSFLTILTTQLQNQDPLEPLSSNEFTQQLVMFSQVEQTLNTNERLDDMLSLLGNNGLTNSISYLGKSVEIGGAKAALENGAAKWTYTLGASAQNVTVNILDEDGNVVRTIDGENQAGTHELVWNGEDHTETLQPDGIYALQIVATDPDGNALNPQITGFGRVESLKNDGADILLTVLGKELPASNVLSVIDSSNPS